MLLGFSKFGCYLHLKTTKTESMKKGTDFYYRWRQQTDELTFSACISEKSLNERWRLCSLTEIRSDLHWREALLCGAEGWENNRNSTVDVWMDGSMRKEWMQETETRVAQFCGNLASSRSFLLRWVALGMVERALCSEATGS